jgi:hypothetical protein
VVSASQVKSNLELAPRSSNLGKRALRPELGRLRLRGCSERGVAPGFQQLQRLQNTITFHRHIFGIHQQALQVLSRPLSLFISFSVRLIQLANSRVGLKGAISNETRTVS